MGSSAESQPAALLRGCVRIKSLTDRQRADKFLTYLQAMGDLELHYDQTYFSRCRQCGWTISWCVLYLCGALCNRLQSYSHQWIVGDSGLSSTALLRRCFTDAGLFLLSALPWLCCFWCLVCLFSAGSPSCPMCSHCLWCLPCLWLLPCIYYLWCLCIRKPATLYVLYHSCTMEGVRLTDGPSPLYHLYLKHLTLKVGRSNLLAIIDGVTDAEAVKGSIENEEPTLGQCCAEIFVFQQAEQDREGDPTVAEARRLKDYVARYFNASQCAGCWFNT